MLAKKIFYPRFICEAKFFGFYTPIYALKRLKMRLFHSKSRKFSNFDLFFGLKMHFFLGGSYENEIFLKMTKKAGSFVGEIAGGGGEFQTKN